MARKNRKKEWEVRHGEGLGLGGEVQGAVPLCEVQRLLAGPVPGEHHGALPLVHEAERPHPVELVEHVRPPAVPAPGDDLRVAVGLPGVAVREFVAQRFDENTPIEETLAKGWHILNGLPRNELHRVTKRQAERYMSEDGDERAD